MADTTASSSTSSAILQSENYGYNDNVRDASKLAKAKEEEMKKKFKEFMNKFSSLGKSSKSKDSENTKESDESKKSSKDKDESSQKSAGKSGEGIADKAKDVAVDAVSAFSGMNLRTWKQKGPWGIISGVVTGAASGVISNAIATGLSGKDNVKSDDKTTDAPTVDDAVTAPSNPISAAEYQQQEAIILANRENGRDTKHLSITPAQWDNMSDAEKLNVANTIFASDSIAGKEEFIHNHDKLVYGAYSGVTPITHDGPSKDLPDLTADRIAAENEKDLEMMAAEQPVDETLSADQSVVDSVDTTLTDDLTADSTAASPVEPTGTTNEPAFDALTYVKAMKEKQDAAIIAEQKRIVATDAPISDNYSPEIEKA